MIFSWTTSDRQRVRKLLSYQNIIALMEIVLELEKKLSLSEREVREDVTQITRLAAQMNTS